MVGNWSHGEMRSTAYPITATAGPGRDDGGGPDPANTWVVPSVRDDEVQANRKILGPVDVPADIDRAVVVRRNVQDRHVGCADERGAVGADLADGGGDLARTGHDRAGGGASAEGRGHGPPRPRYRPGKNEVGGLAASRQRLADLPECRRDIRRID